MACPLDMLRPRMPAPPAPLDSPHARCRSGATASVSDVTAARPWSLFRRVVFRFVALYLLLYYPVLPVDRLPGFGWLVAAWNAAWARVVPRVARHVFGISADFPDMTEGRIDVPYSFARLGCILLFAALGTLAWSLMDRRRASYARLDEWLRVLVRYGLANAMLFYGFSKVFVQQFSAPSLERLLEPCGSMSRMGLLWTFMGASTTYTVFAGAAECVGGVLVFFRRTATLGALVILAVMINVAMLDVSYGVFVKLYAVHLVLMAIYVAAPDLGRLGRLLVLHGAIAPVTFAPRFETRWAERAGRLAKGLFGATLATVAVTSQRGEGEAARLPDLYGIWEVDAFTADGVERPPLTTDGARWRRLVVDRAGGPLSSHVTAWAMTDQRTPFDADERPADHTLTLSRGGAVRAVFDLERTESGRIALQGSLDGRLLRVSLHRIDERAQLRLLGEKFAWVQDNPFHAAQ